MPINDIFFSLYRIDNYRVRNFIIKIIKKIEGGEFYSETLRRIFKIYHKVEIGMYTHGGCFELWQVDPFTTIGRYCSIARGVRIININHPMEFKSTHAFFFNRHLKYCDRDLVEYIPISIGNDVWIGHNAIIMPHVRNIGDGAVIGAGAVVNNDVPPYAVVVGNPARPVRYRFSREVIEELLASRWWEKPIDEITENIQEFLRPYGKSDINFVREK